MSNKIKSFTKFVFLLMLLTFWLWWDIEQAHSDATNVYRSFEYGGTAKLKSPAATTVSIVRSNDPSLQNPWDVNTDGIPYETVEQMVRRAVELAGGLQRIIKSGDTVLIKPNLVQQDSSGSGGVTDVRVVKALVYLIDEIDHGKIKIIVGDGSARPFTTFEKNSGSSGTAWVQLFDVPGYQELKSEALAAGIDFTLSNLNGNSDTNPWPELDSVPVPSGGQALPQNGAYFVHKDVTHATVYISVPVMKVHEGPGFTCALKNQIGIAAGSRYGCNKVRGISQDGKIHKLYHQNLMATTAQNWQDKEIVDLSAIAKIKFVVVDALACLEIQKTPKYTSDRQNKNITNRIVMNTILAGEDPVAVDNVCCRIMGLNPDDIEHITLAERVGLGTNNPDSITIVGATIEETYRRFKKPTTLSGIYGQSNRVWLINGPYQVTSVSGMDTPFISNETSLAPQPGEQGWSEPVYFTDDQIILKDYFGIGSSGQYVSYAFTYFTALKDQQAELWIGSDEAIKVYLNDQLVYNFSGTRTFAGTDYYSDISTIINIKAGVNKLLVKTYQSIGNYNFSLNICELSDATVTPVYRGNRVAGLKFIPSLTSTGIKKSKEQQIATFTLTDCYPNPFNPVTTIEFRLNVAEFVSLEIFDIRGKRVVTLVQEKKAAGTYTVQWNAKDVSSGVYFSKLTAGKFSQTKKMVLLR